jgi:prevent-host-death family protein
MSSHIRYTRSMTSVASRELRNATRALLGRVEQGEEITITVGGRSVARLVPLPRRPRGISGAEFVRRVRPADPGLLKDVAELAPDTTDDLRW